MPSTEVTVAIASEVDVACTQVSPTNLNVTNPSAVLAAMLFNNVWFQKPFFG